MNRKQWIVAGILIAILLVGGCMLLQNNEINSRQAQDRNASVTRLAYCSDEQAKPCIVSFSLDADGMMLVNLLLPDPSFPPFRLTIGRGGNEFEYECRRVGAAPNNAYCVGETMPPGAVLRLALTSSRGGMLLAEGSLSIIGLAFPTVEIVTPVLETAPAETTAVPLTPTSTPIQLQPPVTIPTRTPASYPGPSYP